MATVVVLFSYAGWRRGLLRLAATLPPTERIWPTVSFRSPIRSELSNLRRTIYAGKKDRRRVRNATCVEPNQFWFGLPRVGSAVKCCLDRGSGPS